MISSGISIKRWQPRRDKWESAGCVGPKRSAAAVVSGWSIV